MRARPACRRHSSSDDSSSACASRSTQIPQMTACAAYLQLGQHAGLAAEGCAPRPARQVGYSTNRVTDALSILTAQQIIQRRKHSRFIRYAFLPRERLRTKLHQKAAEEQVSPGYAGGGTPDWRQHRPHIARSRGQHCTACDTAMIYSLIGCLTCPGTHCSTLNSQAHGRCGE